MASYTSRAMAMGAIVVMGFFASRASATSYVVGNSAGWTTGTDYSTWTSGKTFVVGDTLVFNYASGAHTVSEVSSSDYAACSGSNALSSSSSSPTTVTLKIAGTHYFICAIPGHCPGGMKLSVDVSPGNSSAPSTTTPSTSTPALTPPTTTTPTTGTHVYGAAAMLSPVVALVAGAMVVVKMVVV